MGGVLWVVGAAGKHNYFALNVNYAIEKECANHELRSKTCR